MSKPVTDSITLHYTRGRSESAYIRQVEDWTKCAQTHMQTDRQTDRQTKVKTVYPPVLPCSLGGYNCQDLSLQNGVTSRYA